MLHAESIFDDFTDHELDIAAAAALFHPADAPTVDEDFDRLEVEDRTILAAMASLGDRQGSRS